MDASKSSQKTMDTTFNPARREFSKMALAGAMGGPALFSSATAGSAEQHKNAPGIKICVQSSANLTDDFTTELLRTDQEAVVAVVKEMGARRKKPPISAEDFLAQLERQGLKKFVAELRSIGAEKFN